MLVTLAALVVVFPLGSSARSAASTWEGTWETSTDSGAPDPPGGTLVIRADGSGSYKNCLGKIEGRVSGNTLKGTWMHRGPCKDAVERSGPFELELDASGASFTGRWGYASGTGGWIGNWNGTCVEGKCLANGSGPPPTTRPTTTTPTTTAKPVKATRRFIWAADGVTYYTSNIDFRIPGRKARYQVFLNRRQSVGLFTYSEKSKKVVKLSGKATDITVFHRLGPRGTPPSPLTVKRVLVFDVSGDVGPGETDGDPPYAIGAVARVRSDNFLLCKPGTRFHISVEDADKRYPGDERREDGIDIDEAFNQPLSLECKLGGRIVKKGRIHEVHHRHPRAVIRERKG